jgi:hypothetical protein
MGHISDDGKDSKSGAIFFFFFIAGNAAKV